MPGYQVANANENDGDGDGNAIVPTVTGHAFVISDTQGTPEKRKKTVPLKAGTEVSIIEKTETDYRIIAKIDGTDKILHVPFTSLLVSPNKLSETTPTIQKDVQQANIDPSEDSLTDSFYYGLTNKTLKDFSTDSLFINYTNLDASLRPGFSAVISQMLLSGVSWETGRDFKGASVTENLVLNFTDLRTRSTGLNETVLTKYAGKHVVFRFSRIPTTTEVAGTFRNIMLIEEVGEEKQDPRTDADLKIKFDAHSFKIQPKAEQVERSNGTQVTKEDYLEWKPEELRQLYLAIDRIPDKTLNFINGYTFARQAANPNPNVRAQTESHWDAIVVYDSAVNFGAARYGDDGSTTFANRLQFTITHEIGHAIDYAPLNAADDVRTEIRGRLNSAYTQTTISWAPYKAASDAFDLKYKKFETGKTGNVTNYNFGSDTQASKQFAIDKKNKQALLDAYNKDKAVYDGINAEYTKADTDYKSKTRFSGEKYNDVTKAWEETDTDFDKALKDPSESARTTAYSNTNDKEAFAEAFTLYTTNPKQLQMLSPLMYNYFATNFPAN